ncbi:MAG TPA: hypothetical protein VEZ90_18585 [Blastocatellia bacterium]|nr:hypothetical protein [Blastocatellia bacterium]
MSTKLCSRLLMVLALLGALVVLNGAGHVRASATDPDCVNACENDFYDCAISCAPADEMCLFTCEDARSECIAQCGMN